jgi:hypothetical protein
MQALVEENDLKAGVNPGSGNSGGNDIIATKPAVDRSHVSLWSSIHKARSGDDIWF